MEVNNLLLATEQERRRIRQGSETDVLEPQPSVGIARRGSVHEVLLKSPKTADAVKESIKGAPSSSLVPKSEYVGATVDKASYAQATTARSSFSVEFTINDVPVPKESTVFAAVYRAEMLSSPRKAASAVWTKTHVIRFTKVSSESPPTTPIPSSLHFGTSTPRFRQNRQMSAVDKMSSFSRLPFRTEVPNELPFDTPAAKLLLTLRILHGINARWEEIYFEEEDNVEGSTREIILASPVPAGSFSNNKLTAKLNRQLDEPLIVASNVLPVWCSLLARDFSFLVPFETRVTYLVSTSFGYSRSISRWQQQNEQNRESSRGRRVGDSIGDLGRIARTKVRISRDNIVDMMVKVMDGI